MIAFDVHIDGARAMLAGAEDWSILTVHVTASRKEPGSNGCDDYIDCAVHGLTIPNAEKVRHHFRWPIESLKVGSVVTVRVVEVASVDVPAKRYRSDTEIQESPFTDEEQREMRYQDYLALKAEFDPAGG